MDTNQTLKLHLLPKLVSHHKKRVGRGYGSGKGGHTSGRGQKGQRSRRTIPWWFEGGQLPLVRRVPFWRGKGRLNSLKLKPIIVKIGQLNILNSGSKVTVDTLIRESIVNKTEVKVRGLKILANGELEKKLGIIGLKLSDTSRKKVEAAGGKVKEKDKIAVS